MELNKLMVKPIGLLGLCFNYNWCGIGISWDLLFL